MRSTNPANILTFRSLPNHEDLRDLERTVGADARATLIESGPRGLCTYTLNGKYIGMFDMTGYGGNDASSGIAQTEVSEL